MSVSLFRLYVESLLSNVTLGWRGLVDGYRALTPFLGSDPPPLAAVSCYEIRPSPSPPAYREVQIFFENWKTDRSRDHFVNVSKDDVFSALIV